MLSDVVQVLFSCPSEEFKCDVISTESFSSLETTPLNKPLPPVVATATNCIQRLHGCNRVFQHWRLYYQRQSERAHEWSKWQTMRRLFNWWKNLTVLRKQLQCVVGYCSEKEREADRLVSGCG